MKKNSFKILLSITFLLGTILASCGLTSFTKGNVTNYEQGEGMWKNLKVLPQDISKDSLMDLMVGYNIALGVKCSYCHAPSEDGQRLDFASEAKEQKHWARGMIAMTHEINANYFNYAQDRDPAVITDVTCAMCHRGTPNPKDYLNNIGKIAPGGERE